MIVFNLRAIHLQLRNFARRHKWRLRPFKRAVLPGRAAKRALRQLLSNPPRIEASTLAYSEVHPEIAVREIYPAETVLISPCPVSQSAPAREEHSEPAFIFEIPNVNFWAHYGGALVTAGNDLLADLSPDIWGAAHHPIFSRWRLPKSELLGGRVGIAVTPEAAGNYYHWMLDLLPRLSLLKQATGNFANYDAILLNGSRAHYEAESLAAMGVPSEKIHYVDSRHRFQIASALVPSMDHHGRTIAPWKIAALRKLVAEAAVGRTRRLYLSRRRAGVRRVANEDEIVALLRDNGFEILEPEAFSWQEQARMFVSAEIIISPHGAALANAAFCRPGTRIVEISTRGGYRDWYLHLAAAAKLNYHCIEATSVCNASSWSYRAHENDDMLVNPEMVKKFLAAGSSGL